MQTGWIAAVVAALFVGCRSHDHPHDDETHAHDEHGAAEADAGVGDQVITHWTGETELFVEFPTLVVGHESPFAAHLTRLSDFQPIAAGKVVVLLSGGGEPEERFEVTSALVPGIFRPVAQPRHAGKRELTLRLESDALSVVHELGPTQVFADVQAARQAAGEEDEPPGLISFLKEQQWRVDFGTEAVAERSLRASIPVHGSVRARPDGQVRLSAPTAGRLLTAGRAFPRLGMRVERDQLLATLAPRLGAAADLASLELALEHARLEVEHKVGQRERLAGLLAEGAVPERRVIDARHEEARARAELQAAERRLSHFRRLQRSGGAGARGIEIRSPIAGTLAVVDVAPGAFVEESREMFHVVDLDRVWLELRVPEANVGRLSNATGAWFEAAGFEAPFQVTDGPVASGGVVDARTRTVPFVFAIDNPEHKLRVGMFVQAHVVVGEPIVAPAIAVTAIVDDGAQETVYVQVGGESFERRVVRLGTRDGPYAQVLSGVRPGEHVVTRGAYAVKLASSSTQPPAHGHAH